MRKSLIAIALAGSLAAGAAGAQSMTLQTADHDRFIAPTQVQYYRGPVQYRYSNADVRSSPAIDEREQRLQFRINRGVENGRLTHEEANRLFRQLQRIQARERDFMADGRLQHWEERELVRDLDRMADNMRRQLRDEDRRY